MTISIVLRLTLPALAEGRLAGQVEIVEDGTRMVVRDAHELVEAVRRHLDHGGAGSASAPGTASSAPGTASSAPGAAGEIGPPGDPDGGGVQAHGIAVPHVDGHAGEGGPGGSIKA